MKSAACTGVGSAKKGRVSLTGTWMYKGKKSRVGSLNRWEGIRSAGRMGLGGKVNLFGDWEIIRAGCGRLQSLGALGLPLSSSVAFYI